MAERNGKPRTHTFSWSFVERIKLLMQQGSMLCCHQRYKFIRQFMYSKSAVPKVPPQNILWKKPAFWMLCYFFMGFESYDNVLGLWIGPKNSTPLKIRTLKNNKKTNDAKCSCRMLIRGRRFAWKLPLIPWRDF